MGGFVRATPICAYTAATCSEGMCSFSFAVLILISHNQVPNNLKPRSLFDNYEHVTTAQPTSQFDDWVASPPMPCSDPIAYWTVELNSPHSKYKDLARMALDYLSIPGACFQPTDSASHLHIHLQLLLWMSSVHFRQAVYL